MTETAAGPEAFLPRNRQRASCAYRSPARMPGDADAHVEHPFACGQHAAGEFFLFAFSGRFGGGMVFLGLYTFGVLV